VPGRPVMRRWRAAECRSALSSTGSMPPWYERYSQSCVLRRGGEGQRLADGVVVEHKPCALQHRRDRAVPAEQALLRELTQQRAQGKTGHDQRGGPVHGAAQRGGELGVCSRRRPCKVYGARHIVVRDREQQRPHLVLETDPWHVLTPVAQSCAKPEREQRLDPAQNPPGRRKNT